MAIKDWKKTKISIPSERNYGWKWTRGLENIRLYTNKTKTMPNQKDWKYSYSVWFDTKDKDGEAIFLNKTEAINFVNRYMRSH